MGNAEVKRMTDKRYWIWLQSALGEGAMFKEILTVFGTPERLYKSNLLEWKISSVLTAKQIDRLESCDLHKADEIIYTCEQNGWEIIAYDDSRYPERLRTISNPPAVLYTDGTMLNFDDYAVIGIVGTRQPSPYGLKAAEVMAKGVALCGAVVVSGGAVGIDSASHKGAIAAGGRTYAVLGNGFGAGYLKANQSLRNEIKRTGGALISEYPPFTPARPQQFPMRNRIISGLSNGLLVVEAGVKSGSTITANHALEQGRDVFAIPASILDYNFYGTNKLIEDGAVVATTPAVLLERYASSYKTLDLSKMKTIRELMEEKRQAANAPKRRQMTFDNITEERKQSVEKQNKALELSGDERAVYDALTEDFLSVEELSEKCSVEIGKTVTMLTMLEMKGLVQSASGRRYRIK